MTEEILEETALAPSELIELFKHRSATYGLLSRLYAKEVDMTRYGLSRPAPMPATKATASSPLTCPVSGRTP